MIVCVDVQTPEECGLVLVEDLWSFIHCNVQGCNVAQARSLHSFTSPSTFLSFAQLA